MRRILTSLALLLAALVTLSTSSVEAAYIIDTDGSTDDLLSLVSILEDKPTVTSEKISAVKLIVVSANGRGVTSAATALQNVRGVLKLAKREDIPVVLGDPLSWGDRALADQAKGGDAPSCNDHLHFPKTPFDVVHVHPPTVPAPWSQFDEDTLFGLAKSRVPWVSTPILQDSAASNSISVATAAVEAITVAMSSPVLFDRMQYLCLGPLTNVANWLKFSTSVTASTTSELALKLKTMKQQRGNLNVIMIPKVNYNGFKLDPQAADYVLSFEAPVGDGTNTNIIRKLFTASFTSPVERYPQTRTTALKKLTGASSTQPMAIKLMMDILIKKEKVYEKYGKEKQAANSKHAFLPWGSAPYGPQTVLAVLANWRPSLMQGESLGKAQDLKYVPSKGGLIDNTAASANDAALGSGSGSGSNVVVTAGSEDDDDEVFHEDYRATQVYEIPYGHTTTFWAEWMHLLQGKNFMK